MNAIRQSEPPLFRNARAFSLIELLVVVAIIAVLVGLIFPVTAAMQRKGAMAKELNAGRQIMVAFQTYAGENDGNFIKGYDKNVDQVFLPGGKTVSGIMCARYPWRLAGYIGGAIDDIFLINETRKQTDPKPPESFEYQYLASLFPSLGINAYCVGGYDDASGNGYFTSDLVTRMASASHPSSLIVFTSARFRENNSDPETPGFHMVTPPRLWRTKWMTPFQRDRTPSSYGNVDPRWDGKALCAFLDGHVELLGDKELEDMRHWSNTAAENNDRDYSVPR